MMHRRLDLARLREARGISLIETSIACVMMVTVLAGLASLAAVATMHTENEGHLSARTTEYAQDKMEQLLRSRTPTPSVTPSSFQLPAAAAPV
jgi:Tfp pilus assembly protein PilV